MILILASGPVSTQTHGWILLELCCLPDPQHIDQLLLELAYLNILHNNLDAFICSAK